MDWHEVKTPAHILTNLCSSWLPVPRSSKWYPASLYQSTHNLELSSEFPIFFLLPPCLSQLDRAKLNRYRRDYATRWPARLKFLQQWLDFYPDCAGSGSHRFESLSTSNKSKIQALVSLTERTLSAQIIWLENCSAEGHRPEVCLTSCDSNQVIKIFNPCNVKWRCSSQLMWKGLVAANATESTLERPLSLVLC